MLNSLVKAAMYEHMADFYGGFPNENHWLLYHLWYKGGWGMIMTGNVQVADDHLGLGRDMVVPETLTPDTLRAYRVLASVMHPTSRQEQRPESAPRTLIIMQISHAGRQSPVLLGGRPLSEPPLAPSALRLGRSVPGGWFSRLGYKTVFPTPLAMNLQDIDYVVHRFVMGARLAHQSGFDGIELHGAHGCESFSTASFADGT
jgi:2,4-dienoyl-CoA reductase-like NADH-dependent reductase (Old Yellow Enzyme family)